MRAWIGRTIGTGWTRIVVTDLHGPDVEEPMLRGLGAKVIRVHRQEVSRLAEDTASHRSERIHSRIFADADIQNDGTLDALAQAIVDCGLLPITGETA